MKILFDNSNDLWKVECEGKHSNHNRPPLNGKSVHTGKKLEAYDMIKSHTDVKPSQLILGNNKGRPSITKFSSAYNNRQLVAHISKMIREPYIIGGSNQIWY